jgi:hypothetical protein
MTTHDGYFSGVQIDELKVEYGNRITFITVKYLRNGVCFVVYTLDA